MIHEEVRDPEQVVHLEDLRAKFPIVLLAPVGVKLLQEQQDGQNRSSAGPTHKVKQLVHGLATQGL